MKLRTYQQNQELKLSEFDNWITPSLAEIKNSAQFQTTRYLISQIIEVIGNHTNEFNAQIDSRLISNIIIEHIKSEEIDNYFEILNAFINFLFLVTGKSDNNSKCQFPVFLTQNYNAEGYPQISSARGQKTLLMGQIPRVIKSDSVISLILRLSFDSGSQKKYFRKYIDFILNEECYWQSLKAIGLGYFKAKTISHELDFLLPLVIFQIRGSMSASGGHEPENLLRKFMREWGLVDDEDFNIIDSLISEDKIKGEVIEANTSNVELTSSELKLESAASKTRAYDFVIPLKSSIIKSKILVQSQFYAGDSGSVSHKNIDQTTTSRKNASTLIKNIKFVEFLDGAGYYSSLNGDLKKLLAMEDTADFFQLRSAPIKLRRIFQEIGFLTPLEYIHAIIICDWNEIDAIKYLQKDGYLLEEISRIIEKTSQFGIVTKLSDVLNIEDSFFELARKYFLLDSIAEYGSEIDTCNDISGTILIPGYSEFYGIKLSDIINKIIPNAGVFGENWKNPNTLINDIKFLADRGWIKQC